MAGQSVQKKQNIFGDPEAGRNLVLSRNWQKTVKVRDSMAHDKVERRMLGSEW